MASDGYVAGPVQHPAVSSSPGLCGPGQQHGDTQLRISQMFENYKFMGQTEFKSWEIVYVLFLNTESQLHLESSEYMAQ